MLNRRLLTILILLACIAVFLGLVSPKIYSAIGFPSPDMLGLLGIFCLSVPAIRLNEQARQIWLVQSLAKRAAIDGYGEQERVAKLNTIEAELSKYKGGWSLPVQLILYAGYVLLFASAVARMT